MIYIENVVRHMFRFDLQIFKKLSYSKKKKNEYVHVAHYIDDWRTTWSMTYIKKNMHYFSLFFCENPKLLVLIIVPTKNWKFEWEK